MGHSNPIITGIDSDGFCEDVDTGCRHLQVLTDTPPSAGIFLADGGFFSGAFFLVPEVPAFLQNIIDIIVQGFIGTRNFGIFGGIFG